ncbi:hypothetical protein HDV00_003941 [Rhizophlyctis rosea]|nr:hypothetical protein HDV00_003941 [Rhizophlyctis rosea]
MSAVEPHVSFKDLVVGSVYRAKVASGGGWDAVLSRPATPSSGTSSPSTSHPSTPILQPEPIHLKITNSKHSVLVVAKEPISGRVTILLFSSFGNKKIDDIALPSSVPDKQTLGRLLLPASASTINPFRPNQLLPLLPPYTSPPYPENSYLILIPGSVIPSKAKMRKHPSPLRHVPLQGITMLNTILEGLRGDEDEGDGEEGNKGKLEEGMGGGGVEESGMKEGGKGEGGQEDEEMEEDGGSLVDLMTELSKEGPVLDFYLDDSEGIGEVGSSSEFLRMITV